MTKLTATQPAIGQLVRALRLQLKLTQTELAKDLGVTFPSVNRWENGRASPSPLALKMIEQKLSELGQSTGQRLIKEYFGE